MRPSARRQHIRSGLPEIRFFHPPLHALQNPVRLAPEPGVTRGPAILAQRVNHEAIGIDADRAFQMRAFPRRAVNETALRVPAVREQKIQSPPRFGQKLRAPLEPVIKRRQRPRHPRLRPRVFLRRKDLAFLRHARKNAAVLAVERAHPEGNDAVRQQRPVLVSQALHSITAFTRSRSTGPRSASAVLS